MKKIVLLFLFCAIWCRAQHEDLLEIINLEETIEVRQQKIDSFLNAHNKTMSPEVLADCYHDLGSKWYYSNWIDYGKTGDMENAIWVTEKAVELKKNVDSLNQDSLKKSLYNLGYFNYLNDDIFEAIEAYTRLMETGEEDRRTKNAYRELGKCYSAIGDFHKSIFFFNAVKSYYEADKESSYNLLGTYLGIAGTYTLMGYKDYSSEIKFNVQKAYSLLEEIQIDNFGFKEQLDQIEGNRLLTLGKYENALKYHKQVLSNSADDLTQGSLARVYNSIAFSQMKLEKYQVAKNNLNKAISLDSTYTDPYENFGDWHLAHNQFKKGIWFYQKAIVHATDRTKKIVFDELLSEEEMQLSANKISLLNHIVTKANGWLRYYEYDGNKNHLEHALKTFDLADQLVDIIRSYSTEQQSKLFWREKGSSLYMKAVQTCHLLDRPEDAFYFMERNKALLLLEDVTNEQAKEIAQLPDSIAKREFELKRAIYLAENELQNLEVGSEEKEVGLKDLIFKRKREYEQFTDSLATDFPNYTNLKKKVEVLSFEDFNDNYISRDEAVLQYILNDEQGYGLLSSNGESFFFELGEVESLNNEIIDLYGHLNTLISNNEKMAELHAISHSVFRKLLPEEVFKKIKGKKLTIVSDYILQQLPFEALVANPEEATYLIEDVEIRYAYSMSYLYAKNKIPISPEKMLLGIAPIAFDALGLPELSFSGEEVIEAQQVFGGQALLRDEASKQKLLENLNDYRIVHLSTHADIGKQQNHWIALNDEKLFLNEVYANKNQADMVVLSACNTSLGELKKGEGAMSLARGFFHSGAKSVVSSLWTTNDKASKDIMAAFYKELGKGLTKSKALRNAKVNYINRYRGTNISPAHWGALIVIGDNEPIRTAGVLGGYGFWILGLLVAVAVVLFFFRRR